MSKHKSLVRAAWVILLAALAWIVPEFAAKRWGPKWTLTGNWGLR